MAAATAAAVPAATAAEEEARLLRLEEQAEHGGGGAWEYLCLARRLRARRPAHVLRVGLALLNDASARSRLASEQWTLYEQVAVAAMDCQRLDVAKDCIGVLSKQFPGSTRVARLEALLFEAKGEWAEAERAYALILENNPFDQIVHKRKIAIAKAQGDMSLAVDYLNKYLELFMADHDAWRELAETYVSLQMYKQAAFCYEELILAHPTIPLYHIAYAEVLYTMGGLENLQTAKKYYASTIQLTGGKNTRALFGVCLCTSAINQLTKGRNKEEEGSELQSLAAEALLENYKQKAPSKLEHPLRRKCSPLLESVLLPGGSDLSVHEWKAVPDIWRTAAEKYPDLVAVIDPYHEPPTEWTYTQLEQEILDFSQGLRAIGVAPDEKLALFADNSCRWLVADQGIMATGAINVVRGTRSSDEELFQIYTHSESIALVVDSPQFFNRLAESFISRINARFIVLLWGDKSCIDSKAVKDIPLYDYKDMTKLGRESRNALVLSGHQGQQEVFETITSEDVATLIYTSGTSGTPKGVMLTHRNLLHQIKNLWDVVPAEPGDRFLSMLPPWHAYERACEYFIFTYGIQQVYTNVKYLKKNLKFLRAF